MDVNTYIRTNVYVEAQRKMLYVPCSDYFLNYPYMGQLINQIRYIRSCCSCEIFLVRELLLTGKLLKQEHTVIQLKLSLGYSLRNICVADDYEYVPIVVIQYYTSLTLLIIGFLSWVPRRVLLAVTPNLSGAHEFSSDSYCVSSCSILGFLRSALQTIFVIYYFSFVHCVVIGNIHK